MSLKIWLTGNGNMNNQGTLGELTQVTAPTYVDGKMGKAFTSAAYSMTAEQTADVFNNNGFTIAFWVYVNAAEGAVPSDSSNTMMLFGNSGTDGTLSSARRSSVLTYPTVNDLHWWWFFNDTTSGYYGATLSGVLPSYTWTHVVMQHTGSEMRVYINDELALTKSFTMNIASFAAETRVLYARSDLYINDLRVYIHC